MIRSETIQNAMDYPTYFSLMENLVAEGRTSGLDQSGRYIAFTKLNLQRMQRLDKTIILLPELVSEVSKLKSEFVCLILTETWCGDAAQTVPIFRSLEKIAPHLQLKFLLRDEHLDIMDQYLTNGSRSIPKLICFNKQSGKELFTWGPRPAELQEIAHKLIQQKVSPDEKALIIQKWYNTDKTLSVQKELLQLIQLHFNT
jgi:hypothetical protein